MSWVYRCLKYGGLCIIILVTAISCSHKPTTTKSGLHTRDFETTINGKSTSLYVLTNAKGMEVCVTNYGGRIVSVVVPDKGGRWYDVALGMKSIDDYLRMPNDLGAVIGRFSGIIRVPKTRTSDDAHFTPADDDNRCIDGGKKGFQYQVFDAQQLGSSKLILTYVSPNDEEGFPGNLMCSVTYKLTDDNALDISYDAGTDRATPINITNRLYINLSGNSTTPCMDDRLTIHAKYYLSIDKSRMPNGKITRAKGTPLDFQHPTPINKGISQAWFAQIQYAQGFNHYFIRSKNNIDRACARLISEKTGIVLEIFSDEPGIQFYSGNDLDGTLRGKHDIIYNQRCGIVLAPQKIPDTSTHDQLTSAVLKPGQKYEGHTIYKFSISK